MCTATWLIRPDGYDLFFNRDESRQRGLALAPKLQEIGARSALTPTDRDAGGTWIGANDAGLGLALLNAWHLDAKPPCDSSGELYRSRGLLVRDLLRLGTLEEVRRELEATELARYRGFSLVSFEPGAAPTLFEWDGDRLRRAPAAAPLSSSSYDAAGAGQARAQHLADVAREGELTAERLLTFHKSHVPERGPFSACMHRRDACTVSFSHVSVDSTTIRFAYAAGAPCETELSAPLRLERRS